MRFSGGKWLVTKLQSHKRALQCGLPSPSLGSYYHHQVGPRGHRLRTVWVGGSRRVGDSKEGLRPGLFSSLVVVGHYHRAYPTRHGVWGNPVWRWSLLWTPWNGSISIWYNLLLSSLTRQKASHQHCQPDSPPQPSKDQLFCRTPSFWLLTRTSFTYRTDTLT